MASFISQHIKNMGLDKDPDVCDECGGSTEDCSCWVFLKDFSHLPLEQRVMSIIATVSEMMNLMKEYTERERNAACSEFVLELHELIQKDRAKAALVLVKMLTNGEIKVTDIWGKW